MVQNINTSKYQVSNAGLMQKENLQENLTKSKQVVTDNFESNSAIQTLGGSKDPNVMRKTMVLVAPLMLIDKGINKLIGGKESNSILTKIAGVGDNISDALHLDKIFSHEKREKISNFINKNKFTKYFTNTFKAEPKTSMARNETMSQKYKNELINHLKNVDIADIGLTKTTQDTLKNLATDVVQDKIPVKEIIDATDDILANGIDSIPKGGLIGGNVSLSEINNKLKAAESQIGKTSVGKTMAKGALKTKNVLTYGGGLLSLYFTASAIMQAVKATKEAPKGEKLSTFMHVLSEQYVGILLFQPSINLLYKAGGNKYRGMTPEAREALKTLVQNASKNPDLTKEGLKIANIQKNLLIKGVDKDKVAALAEKSLPEVKNLAKGLKKEGAKLKLWEKPLKFMGKILDAGLDKIKTHRGPSLKGFAGGLMRFALIMFVIQPIIQKPLTKLCHKIFGKPTAYLEKQNAQAEAKNKKDNKPAVSEVKTQQEKNTQIQNGNELKDTNLIKRYTTPSTASTAQTQQTKPQQQGNIEAQTPIKPQNSNEIPLFNLKDKTEKQERYIPSIEPVITEDNSKELDAYADSILKDTDKIIKNINKSLK